MEADWSAEIGPGLPEIHVPWEGFVDLRRAPDALTIIPEAVRSAELARALSSLNSNGSPVFTAKSDLWTIDQAEIDPYEFAACPEDTRCGWASYIDIVERDAGHRASFPFHETRAKKLVADLHASTLRNGRVDLVIRAAFVNGQQGYGISLYAAGCGANDGTAKANWEAVLGAAVLATIG
jgi:hypothetical protein